MARMPLSSQHSQGWQNGRHLYKNNNNLLIEGRVPPSDRDIEANILGCILLNGKAALDIVVSNFKTSHVFYSLDHQIIFDTIKDISERSEVDSVSLLFHLKDEGKLDAVGGHYYITQLGTISSGAALHSLDYWCTIVKELYFKRAFVEKCHSDAAKIFEGADVFDVSAHHSASLDELLNDIVPQRAVSFEQGLNKLYEEIEYKMHHPEVMTGVPSGFPSIDSLTNGWQPSDLIILAARPSVGKTAFALNLAMNAAKEHKSTAVFCLEMSNTKLISRCLAAESQVGLFNISSGMLEKYQKDLIDLTIHKIKGLPLHFDDTATVDIDEICAKIRILKAKEGIELVIIDYLQLISNSAGGNMNREQEISKISRKLKLLAKDLNIPIIALSQLSRAVETRSGDRGKIPQLSDLRESGAIEQDADMVMFLYRPAYHGIANDENGNPIEEGETYLNIAKNRNGSLDTVKLIADLSIQKFNDSVSTMFTHSFSDENCPF